MSLSVDTADAREEKTLAHVPNDSVHRERLIKLMSRYFTGIHLSAGPNSDGLDSYTPRLELLQNSFISPAFRETEKAGLQFPGTQVHNYQMQSQILKAQSLQSQGISGRQDPGSKHFWTAKEMPPQVHALLHFSGTSLILALDQTFLCQ